MKLQNPDGKFAREVNNMKRILQRTGLFLSVMALLLMTACGGGSNGNPSGNGAGGESNTGSDSSAANSGASDVVTVEIWGWNPSEENGEIYVNAFNESHTDIQIKYVRAEYNDYLYKLKLSMLSGEGPDIFGVQAGEMMMQYEEFMEDLTPYAEAAWGSDWEDRFYEFGLTQLQNNGKTNALPFFMSAAGYLWYNKTILDAYGLEPPATFEEWVQLSKQLNEQGVTPFVQGAKDDWVNFDMFIALANEIAPGKIYEAEAGTVPWTDPDLVEAMRYWKRLFDEGVMQKGALGVSQYPDMHDKWAKGESVMILFGTWNNDHMTADTLANLKTSLGISEDYQFMPFRFPDVNGDGQPGRLFGGPDVGWAMNNNSKNKEAAWRVLEWLESEEAQQVHAKQLNIPGVKGIPLDESNVMFEEQKDVLKWVLEDVDNMIGKREFLYPDLKTALGDALQMVAAGEISPEKAMENVEKASQSISR